MYDIICSYADSEADVIYFKIKSVLSENIRIESNRCSYINIIIDRYLADGDEWPVRATIYTVHCKMCGVSTLEYFKEFFKAIMPERTDYERSALPLSSSVATERTCYR